MPPMPSPLGCVCSRTPALCQPRSSISVSFTPASHMSKLVCTAMALMSLRTREYTGVPARTFFSGWNITGWCETIRFAFFETASLIISCVISRQVAMPVMFSTELPVSRPTLS